MQLHSLALLQCSMEIMIILFSSLTFQLNFALQSYIKIKKRFCCDVADVMLWTFEEFCPCTSADCISQHSLVVIAWVSTFQRKIWPHKVIRRSWDFRYCSFPWGKTRPDVIFLNSPLCIKPLYFFGIR